MRKYVGTFIIIAALLLPLSFSVGAQDGPEVIEAQAFGGINAVLMEAEDLAEPPPLTEEQLANLAWAEENTPGALPVIDGEQAEPAGPEPGTESAEADARIEPGAPLAPGTAQIWKFKRFGSSLPGGQSNVMEVSVDVKGKQQWATGNWFAARSTDKGTSFTYFSPWTGMADFCCDQVIRHDMARDIWLWMRMGIPDGAGNNRFALSVDYQAPFTGGYWTYFITPTAINANWGGTWWDYPAMALTADHLWISWNMFDSGGNYVRSVVLKVPLDALAAAGPFGGWYWDTNAWATFKFVDGADHTMYFASNWPNSLPQNSRLGIWRWRDQDTTLSMWTKTITAWSFTGGGDAVCGAPNWADRYDQRVLAGARYNIDTTDLQNPGRNVLGWWWNVKQGGAFARPYIEGAAFYEDTITQVAGSDGRPYAWNDDLCFAYPDVATNEREDLGMVFNYADSSGYHKPKSAYSLADDYIASPPGWMFYGIGASQAGPSDQKWGDYNTVRAAHGPAIAWTAGVHVIPTTSNCSNCSEPIVVSFGRERDKKSWQQW